MNKSEIYNYLLQKGYSPTAAAAWMGNIYGESKYDPMAVERGNNAAGYGLFQLTGPLRKYYDKWLEKKGVQENPANAAKLQIDFVDKLINQPKSKEWEQLGLKGGFTPIGPGKAAKAREVLQGADVNKIGEYLMTDFFSPEKAQKRDLNVIPEGSEYTWQEQYVQERNKRLAEAQNLLAKPPRQQLSYLSRDELLGTPEYIRRFGSGMSSIT